MSRAWLFAPALLLASLAVAVWLSFTAERRCRESGGDWQCQRYSQRRGSGHSYRRVCQCVE